MLKRLLKHLTVNRNKRGEEFVEASLVLPVLIFTIISMICLCVYYYQDISNETQMHMDAVNLAMQKDSIFNIKYKKSETSRDIQGIIQSHMGRKSQCRVYIMKEADIIRNGEMVDYDE